MADEAAGILITGGALGCEVSMPARRASNRHHGKPAVLCAYFDRITPALLKRLQTKLQAAQMLADGATPELRKLEDPGWATMWQARFAPLRIGGRFLIVPPWRRERGPGRLQIVIQPGQAFGTGHHASTAGTLCALENLCASRRFADALDVGTGSGILAIAMAKLGVAEIIGIDNDPVALTNAEENTRLNRVSMRIRLSATPLSSIRRRFGLITSNILSSTLIRMAPDLKRRLRPQGYLVLAGILRREAAAVITAYMPELGCVNVCNRGAWTTLIFQK
jgi:ribosomal protein L11 methyltransferase